MNIVLLMTTWTTTVIGMEIIIQGSTSGNNHRIPAVHETSSINMTMKTMSAIAKMLMMVLQITITPTSTPIQRA
jgi:hypothetical protein